MKNKAIKNQIDQARKKLKVAGKKVDHITKVVDGFNFYIEKRAVVIDRNTVYLYVDLWGEDRKNKDIWMKNAYIYMRMKLGFAEGATVYFKDIETDELIGRYELG